MTSSLRENESMTGEAAVSTGVASGGLVLERDDGEVRIRRWGYPLIIKVDPLNGGAEQFFVGSERIPPGRKIHPHRHNYTEELLFIMGGIGEMRMNNESFTVTSGSIVFVPRAALHGLTNTGNEDLQIVFTFPTQGIDRYFRETSAAVGESLKAMSATDMNAVRSRYENYVLYEEADLSHYTSK